MHAHAPKLFRARKREKEILILGTDHSFGLDIFTKAIQHIILSPKKLLMERLQVTIPDMAKDFMTLDKRIIFRGDAESKFSLLSDYNKAFVKNTLKYINDELVKEGIAISELKDSIIFGLLYGLLQVVNSDKEYDGIHSMDEEIKTCFKAKDKEVIGLETTHDVIPTILDVYQRLSPEEIADPQSHFLMMLDNVSDPESHADYLHEKDIVECEEPDVAERNENWFPSILQELETSNSLLIAVGIAHVTHINAGLLRWFNSLGYAIEIIDAQEQFKPFELPGFKTYPSLYRHDLFFEQCSLKESRDKENKHSKSVLKSDCNPSL